LADAYDRSATVIEDRCDALIQSDRKHAGDHGTMYIPVGILRAFSIELALKSLLYAEQSRQVREHRLQSLFNLLTEQSQDNISSVANKDLTRPRLFKDVLPEISNVFVEWRYVHEKLGDGAEQAFDTVEMKVIAHAVMHVINGWIDSNPSVVLSEPQ